MLMPKRTKYRRVQRGRMKGAASRGNKVSYGEFGIQACEPGWITGNQIEAARVAMTRPKNWSTASARLLAHWMPCPGGTLLWTGNRGRAWGCTGLPWRIFCCST